jgi:outer membrane protein
MARLTALTSTRISKGTKKGEVAMVRTAAIFLLALMPVAAGAQDATSAASATGNSAETLTLEQAVAIGQSNNRQIKIAYQSVLQANDEILAAKSQRLPQFSLYLLGSQLLTPVSFEFQQGILGTVNGSPVPSQTTKITTGTTASALVSGQAIQPLSQLYRLNLNVHLQQTGKKLQEETLRQQRQQVTDSVKTAYYNLLQLESGIEATEESIKSYQELDRTTVEYVSQKTALEYQSLGVKAQLAQSQLDLVTLQDNYATQKENLNVLLGRDIRTDFRVSGVPAALPEEMNLAAAQDRALKNRSEIRQAQLKNEQAIFAERIQKSKYIPDVGAAFTYFSPFTSSSFVPRNITSVGFLLTWDVWDWGYKKHVLDEKRHTTEQSRLNISETESQVLVDVDNHFRKLREARAKLSVAQLGKDAEKEKLRVVLEQYKQKAALLSTALQEQSNWSQAVTNYQQALAGFWTARADFEKSLGED